MRISQNSTNAIFNSLRHSMSSLQGDLIKAQKEVSTGRVADAGLSLGVLNGRRVSVDQDVERLKTISDTNGLAVTRLAITMSLTGSVNDVGQGLLSSLTASIGQVSTNTVTQVGESALAAITGLLNTSVNGEAIFGGINTGVAPIASYEEGGVKQALDTLFQNHFGFTKTDPAAITIDGTAMTVFLDTVVQPMFLGSDWGNVVSSASDVRINARIDMYATSEASISANEDGFRGVMFAAVISAEFFSSSLSVSAKSATAEKAISLVGTSAGALAGLQGEAGYLSSRIESTNERISKQIDSLKLISNEMVEVDPYEAATTLNSLITQIETSYALTGRIQKLSLMRYIQ